MKYIQTKLILCAMFAASPLCVNAQDVAVNESDSLNNGQDPLVQIAYRKVAQSELLGGVSVVDMEKLTEKNYNTYSLDNMQGYVGGWNGNSLWGMDGDNAGYLVLVDGVPRDANNVLPTEISQITFLKSAQAVVLYGSRAAKGAILITTKRGKEEKLKVEVRANTGFNVAKSFPEYLGSAEYMTLYNEARVNDELSPLYSETDIYNHASGENPYRYPNMNFYSSDYIKKAYNRSDVTAEISGGNKRARFYSNIGYYRQGDFFKFGEAENNSVSRLNIRGNVDVNINDFIDAYINANATFYDSKSAIGDYWSAASTFRPNRPEFAAPLIPLSYIDPNATAAWDLINASGNIIDGKYFLAGTQIDPTNIFADYYAAGRNKYTSRQFQFDTGVNMDLSKVLKGLSFHALFAVDYATSYNTSFNNSYAIYTPVWSNADGKDIIVGLTQEGTDEKSGVQNISGSTDNRTIAFSGWFDYKNTFANDHNVSAMLIASGYQQTLSAQYHRVCNANLALQVGYNYKQKYYMDFGGALIHSAKLAPGHRNAFSPSLTLGWKLSNESFLADSDVVDDLTVSVSGSILNEDIDLTDFYMYEAVWQQAYGWSWYDGSLEKYTMSVRGANEDLTFIKRKEISANVHTSLWNKMITADASFFINSMEGYVVRPKVNFPNYFFTYYPEASIIPYINNDNNRRIGFDFAVNFNKRIGEVDFSLGVAGTYYDTKATKRSEVNEWDYQNREGKPLDGIWGLESLGFFQSEEEIENSPEQQFGGTVRPGDIKYKDQNGDGVINSNDQVYLGKGGWYGSPFTFGLNLTAKWKDFTFFALGTAGIGSYGVKNSSYYWVYGDGKYSAVVRDRWTPETAATATYPRLTTETGANNFQTSDFWMYKANRFDLAKIQITYDLPKRFLQNTFVKGFSAYISGSNLLTISKEREHMEMNVGSAPQTRFYNLGVKVTF